MDDYHEADHGADNYAREVPVEPGKPTSPKSKQPPPPRGNPGLPINLIGQGSVGFPRPPRARPRHVHTEIV